MILRWYDRLIPIQYTKNIYSKNITGLGRYLIRFQDLMTSSYTVICSYVA